jgi:hypothetical protein
MCERLHKGKTDSPHGVTLMPLAKCRTRQGFTELSHNFNDKGTPAGAILAVSREQSDE